MQLSRAADGAEPKGQQPVVFRPAQRDGGLSAWIVAPRTRPAWGPPIVAVHGWARGAREQAALLAREAASCNRMVIAPIFERVHWPRYQQVVLKGRADLALIGLLADLRAEDPTLPHDIVLSGFSGGAQFAHRFAMLHPGLVRRLVVTSAGWYTFPDSAPYPYGLGHAPGPGPRWGSRVARSLGEFLRLPITVAVGAFDNVPDKNVRRGEEIDRVQGIDRLTRGRRWVEALHTAGLARDIEPDVSFHVLERCWHDFAMCVRLGNLDRRIVAPEVGEGGA